MIPRILIIAGSDSGGGAGIQADIKTTLALGGYAATAITAVTVQNTLGVEDIFPVPPAIITAQINAVLDDIGADIIKIGMLGDAATIHAVADAILPRTIPYVLDPVMRAKGGAALLAAEAQHALLQRLIPHATLLTPNIPEAETLLARPIKNVAEMQLAAQELCTFGAYATLLKGGHMEGDVLCDVLAWEGECITFPTTRINTRHTHGTGCTLASAIATLLARKFSLPSAIEKAQAYVHGAITYAPEFGNGHGPLWHGWQQTQKYVT